MGRDARLPGVGRELLRPLPTSSRSGATGSSSAHNISCWMRGGDELLEAFCEAAGRDADEADHGGASSPDGELFVKGFECLGACDIAPMASIDERYYGPLDAGRRRDGDRASCVPGAEPVADKALAKRAARRRARARPGRSSRLEVEQSGRWLTSRDPLPRTRRAGAARRSRATAAAAATRRWSARSGSSTPTSC